MISKFQDKRNAVVTKIFLAMLAPTIFMNLTTAIASMADSIIIGQYLDDASLSVVTFATPIYMVINTLAALFTVGGCISMSIDMGKGDKKSATKAFSQSIEYLFITGMLFVIAGVFFSGEITSLLGAGEDIFSQVESYSKIVLLGGMIFVFNIGVAFFVRNDGRPTLSMIGMVLGIVTDIILNLVFVGNMGLGVEGAAYSTVIGQMIGLLINASHFFTKKNTLKFKLSFDKTVLRIIKNGVSTALTFIYQFVTILILNHFVVAMAGTEGVVVYTVVFNLYTVALSLFEGLSQTVQPMVGVYFGEKSNKNIKQSLKLAFVATIIICGFITVVLEIFPSVVPKVFGISQESIVKDASLAVRIYATSMIIMTFNVIIGYYLQSIEYAKMAAWLVSLRCCILFLACVFVLGKNFGLNGVWASYTLSEVLTFVVLVFMNVIKRKNLQKQGISTDVFFLNRKTEDNTILMVFNQASDNFDEFSDEVMNNACDVLASNTKIYLNNLKTVIPNKKRGYIEVLINNLDQKIFIKDNFDHSNLEKNMESILNTECEYEYGPVLGWNRICMG